MYGVVREYTVIPSQDSGEIVSRIRDEFLPIIRDTQGLKSYGVMVTDKGELVTVGMFVDRKGADESVERAREWVRENMASAVGPPKVTSGEVLIAERVGEGTGFGVLRRVRLNAGARNEAVELMRSKLMPMLKEVPGFLRGAVIAAGPDELLVVGAYRDRASSEEATRKAMPFMQQNAGHLMAGPPAMSDGEIKLFHVNETALT